eukprot:326135-Pelagomonas_calceolata.AAC.2
MRLKLNIMYQYCFCTLYSRALLNLQAGADKAPNLRVLYASNNKIAGWNEIDRLASLAHLEDLLLVGNPLYNDYKDNNALSEYRVEVSTSSVASTEYDESWSQMIRSKQPLGFAGMVCSNT